MKWIGMLSAAVALAVTGRAATTYHVAPGGVDADGYGGSWALPYATISNAVAKAQDDDVILISNGTYTVTKQISVSSNVHLRSYNNGAVDRAGTLVVGGSGVRGFYLNNTGAVLEGVTVTNGALANDSGGGIYLNAGLVTNCAVVNCLATNGGGVYMGSAGALKNSMIANNTSATNCTGDNYGGGGLCMIGGLAAHCLISNNVALRRGGGVSIRSGGTLADSTIVSNWTVTGTITAGGGGVSLYYNNANLVANCVISGNAYAVESLGGGGGGGGVGMNQHATSGGGGVVSNCVITDNTARGCGGGVYFQAGSQAQLGHVIASRIYSNRVTDIGQSGGGAYWYQGAGRLTDCEIVGNSSPSAGGGIYASAVGTYYYLTNCLIANNTGSYAGGLNIGKMSGVLDSCTIAGNATRGIYFGSGGETLLRNCIIASNGTDITYVAGQTVSVYYCCTTVTTGAFVAEGCISGPPGFANYSAGEYRLAADSACINVGTNEPWMDGARDLGRLQRVDPFSGKVDIGAYEFLPPGALLKLK